MEDFMDAHVNTNSLLQGQSIPPFFFPKAKPSGPDIVFYIRATLKTRSAPTIEAHVEDHGRFCPTNNTYISMIIAYPAMVTAKPLPRPDFVYNLRPRPDPKREHLTQPKIIIDKCNIDRIFPQSHIDLLNGIKSPMKRQAVDKQEAESLKKTKKD
ncbi:hypothetical protein BG015_006734 [Linnemannia schmuckeri]|uniref:Uncharacterized protein n=1 Tax=Linnemannia schmuckeri TaxID=64567 RepID=A0A9P5R0A1_9FUNG|nr:hypothetical protein BG015_006734 [Linnemannia schmuckeri]